MKTYISLSKYPGKTGKYYYTSFFNHYSIDASYTPLGTDDLSESIKMSLDNGVSGISVSMPYKKQVINFLTEADKSVTNYDSCNTVVVRDNKLYGYNSDLQGVIWASSHIKSEHTISILGNGCMGNMFYRYLADTNKVDIYSPSLGNWELRNQPTDVIINCTPYGTIDSNSPYDEVDSNTKLIIDLAVNPGFLSYQAKENDIKYISGKDFYKYQFMRQFEIYTGMKVDENDYNKISIGC